MPRHLVTSLLKKFNQNTAKSPHICCRLVAIDIFAKCFGTHELWGSAADASFRNGLQFLREAEIAKQRTESLLAEEDVGTFQIAVRNCIAMEIDQCIADLKGKLKFSLKNWKFVFLRKFSCSVPSGTNSVIIPSLSFSSTMPRSGTMWGWSRVA